MPEVTSGWLPMCFDDQNTNGRYGLDVTEDSDSTGIEFSIGYLGEDNAGVTLSEDDAMVLAQGLIGRIVRRRQIRAFRAASPEQTE